MWVKSIKTTCIHVKVETACYRAIIYPCLKIIFAGHPFTFNSELAQVQHERSNEATDDIESRELHISKITNELVL